MSPELPDRLTNRLFALYVIEKASRRGTLTGKVKLMKLLYEAQEEMGKAGIRGFAYQFYRWDYGPLSNDALSDLEWLVGNELAYYREDPWEVGFTARGEQVLKECHTLLEQNQPILALVDKVVERHLLETGRTLREEVYDRYIPGESRRVRQAEMGELLLEPVPREKANQVIKMDEEWEETLALLLSKKSMEALKKSQEDVRQGRTARYVPLSTESSS